MPRSTASATMFFECVGSSSITTIPPKPMIDRCSPVLPSGLRAIGCVGVAEARRALAAAAAVKALCFKKSRRSIGGVLLKGTYEQLNADSDSAQVIIHEDPRIASRHAIIKESDAFSHDYSPRHSLRYGWRPHQLHRCR